MRAAISITERDPLWTETQTAQVVNVSIRTLQSWRAKRLGPPFVRVGRAVRYRPRDIFDWVEAQIVAPTVSAPPRGKIAP